MTKKLDLFLGAVHKRYGFGFGDNLGRATNVTIDKTIESAHLVSVGSDYFTILSKEVLQPSQRDLNISMDERTTGSGLPKPRRAVICKGELERGKITLYPNPAYQTLVEKIAKEFGAKVGNAIEYSPQCWESFHDGYPPELGSFPSISIPASLIIIAAILYLLSRG